ncbi:MAG: leucine-rich repeat domain-containing protein, partial [Thermoguttaceae bacterium]|nr:leucine-rich repeat domain-containing protein [Thermoguttaceae bacterium]
ACVVPAEIDGRRVVKISDGAFYGRASLTSVAFPNCLKIIDKDAFAACESLTSIAFPRGLKTVGFRAFAGCKALTNIAFPQGLKTVDFGGNDASGRGCVEEAGNRNAAVFFDLPSEIGRRIRGRSVGVGRRFHRRFSLFERFGTLSFYFYWFASTSRRGVALEKSASAPQNPCENVLTRFEAKLVLRGVFFRDGTDGAVKS